jgi:mercuric ion transport protein
MPSTASAIELLLPPRSEEDLASEQRVQAPRAGKGLTPATALGAVVSALLASVCCIGPLVLAALGLGGAGLVLRFEPYRPHLVALTLAILAVGFFVTYRRPLSASANEADCACEHPRASRLGRIGLWVAAVLAVALLIFPYLAARLFQ